MFFDLSERRELSATAQTLASVADVISSHATHWFLVGAAARDVVLSFGYGLKLTRATYDLDIAVAVPTWMAFESIACELVSRAGFTRDARTSHRFRTEEAVVDIVPFGGVAADGVVVWPLHELEMSVLGFAEAYAEADQVILPGKLSVLVASPPGLLILKIIAWEERHREQPKHDAVDIAALLETYSSNVAVDDLYTNGADLLEQFGYDNELAAAALIGRYAAKIARPATAQQILRILTRETDAEGHLALAIDMSHRSTEAALRLLEALRAGFRGERQSRE